MSVTRRMVLPVYKYLKFADITNIIPVTLDSKRGKFRYEPSLRTAIIYKAFFCLSCLKSLHLIYAFVHKAGEMNESNVAVVLLIALWCSLCATTTFWSYELFNRGLGETIILFNSIEFAPTTSSWRLSLSKLKSDIRDMKKLNMQELLLLVSPYGLISYVFLYCGMMVTFPHWYVFITSLVPKAYLSTSPWLMRMLVFVEGLAALFMECNLIFLLFFELSLQTTHFATLDGGTEKIRSLTSVASDKSQEE